MRRSVAMLALVVPAALHAQSATSKPLTEAQQVASAVLPLPAEFRGDATILGYRAGSTTLATLREGTGAFTCLASNPAGKQFHVACYHKSMEAFMERGRALRAQGVKGDAVDSARFREVRSGELKMPVQPAALYSITGPAGSYDAQHGTTRGAKSLYVVYIPGATPASTGIVARPLENGPWMMYPGTPKAHIMFVPKM